MRGRRPRCGADCLEPRARWPVGRAFLPPTRRSGRALTVLPCLAVLLAVSSGPLEAAAPQENQVQTHVDAGALNALAKAGGLRAVGAFPFDYQYLAFHGGSSDLVALWAAVSVEAGRIRGVFEGGWHYSLSLGLELFQDDSLVVAKTRRTDFLFSRQVADTTRDGFPLQTMVSVPPGVYDYRLVVKDMNWPDDRSVNVVQGSLTVPVFDETHPVVSSIAVAADSVGTFKPATGIDLQLNAAAIVEKDARPFIYFEVYGLTPGGSYRGEIKLASTWVSRGRGETFTGPYEPFQMQYRGSVPADPTVPVRAVLRLETRDAEPGPYEVQVRVTDLETGERSEIRKAGLKIRPPTIRAAPITEVEVRSEGESEGK
jgi:hypothetical protein